MSCKQALISVGLIVLLFYNNASADDDINKFIRESAIVLEKSEDIFPVIRKAGDRRLVLLGEASHGTSEYYTWRTVISKYLIEEFGFNFIAIEGDWPSVYQVNRYVKNLPGAASSVEKALAGFERWPHWMWRNREVVELVEWLKHYNSKLEPDKMVGFYGIDLQNKQMSIESVIEKLKLHDEKLAETVKNKYECITQYQSANHYLQAVASRRVNCGEQMEQAYKLIASSEDDLSKMNEYDFFDLYHNARLIKHAERQIRANLKRGSQSWNHRARHFQYTADRLLDYYGENSKGIVWAHNTHIGDARATDMAGVGMVNIGQLAREAYGKDSVFSIGFGSYSGEVLAGRVWGGKMERMTLPEARQGSWESLLKSAEHDNFVLLFEDFPEILLGRPFPHRAVGVTYQPESDSVKNYVQTILPGRYDAFVFLSNTKGLHPID